MINIHENESKTAEILTEFQRRIFILVWKGKHEHYFAFGDFEERLKGTIILNLNLSNDKAKDEMKKCETKWLNV